jgi:hypothetical protein
MPERTTRDYEERDSLEVSSVGVSYLCEGTLQREKRRGGGGAGAGAGRGSTDYLRPSGMRTVTRSSYIRMYVFGGGILGDLMYVAIPDMRSGARYHMSLGPPLLAFCV